MALIHWKLVFLEIIGCIFGTLGWCLTLNVYIVDSEWNDFFHRSSLEKKQHGLKIHEGFFKTMRSNVQYDCIAFMVISPILMVAIWYALRNILNNAYRENLKTHKSINRIIAFSTVISGFSLLFTFLMSDMEFYNYVEINFYGKNYTNQKFTSKISIHWPCNYNSINPSPLKAPDSFVTFAQPSVDVPVMGPHTCQYRFYKLSAVVCFFLYMVISRVILQRINTHLMARLADAPFVADPARYLRQEIPLQLLRMQHERLARERPEPCLQEGSTYGPANRNLVNGDDFPIPPTSRTIDSFILPCFNCTGNCNNVHLDALPPPYPGTPEVIVPEAPHSIPTVVSSIQEPIQIQTNDNNLRESPPPSYNSIVFEESVSKC